MPRYSFIKRINQIVANNYTATIRTIVRLMRDQLITLMHNGKVIFQIGELTEDQSFFFVLVRNQLQRERVYGCYEELYNVSFKEEEFRMQENMLQDEQRTEFYEGEICGEEESEVYNPELTKVSLRNYMKLVKIMPSMGGSNINFHDPVRNSLLPQSNSEDNPTDLSKLLSPRHVTHHPDSSSLHQSSNFNIDPA